MYDNSNLTLKNIKTIILNTMNNINLLDVSILEQATQHGIDIYNTQISINNTKSIVFGTKQNLIKYNNQLQSINHIKLTNPIKYEQQKEIFKEEYKRNKLHPFSIIGRKVDKGNRKFKLDILDNNKIIFKPDRNTKIDIFLPKLKNKMKKNLLLLQSLCENKNAYFNCSFDLDYVYISFDETILSSCIPYNFKENRILSIDLNPNYIAYVICDYEHTNRKNILYKEIYSIKEINNLEFTDKYKNSNDKDKKQKYITNKRKYELLEISKNIINTAKYFKVETIAIEDLNIKSKDNGSKVKNKLYNNKWNRSILVNNLTKRCNIEGIRIQNTLAHYSSFVGQMQNMTEYDSVAASLEIGRRCNIFIRQYIKKQDLTKYVSDKSLISNKHKVDVVYPVLSLDNLPSQWKEKVGVLTKSNRENWISFYQCVKKSYDKLNKSSKTYQSYRFLFNESDISLNFYRLNHTDKSKVKVYAL